MTILPTSISLFYTNLRNFDPITVTRWQTICVIAPYMACKYFHDETWLWQKQENRNNKIPTIYNVITATAAWKRSALKVFSIQICVDVMFTRDTVQQRHWATRGWPMYRQNFILSCTVEFVFVKQYNAAINHSWQQNSGLFIWIAIL